MTAVPAAVPLDKSICLDSYSPVLALETTVMLLERELVFIAIVLPTAVALVRVAVLTPAAFAT